LRILLAFSSSPSLMPVVFCDGRSTEIEQEAYCLVETGEGCHALSSHVSLNLCLPFVVPVSREMCHHAPRIPRRKGLYPSCRYRMVQKSRCAHHATAAHRCVLVWKCTGTVCGWSGLRRRSLSVGLLPPCHVRTPLFCSFVLVENTE
jgi:hypothetical protein